MGTKGTREELDKELTMLMHDIEVMGRLVSTSIITSVKALLSGERELAQQVIKGDDNIDLMQIMIEDKCILLIALQQPLAKDLRVLTTALKIVTDLERIGDYAENIARLSVKKIKDYDMTDKYAAFEEMAKEVAYMLENSINAYVNVDIKKAEEIHQHDDVVDAYCKSLHNDILKQIQENAENVDLLTGILAILHYLERAGDHVTNISEWVVYLSTGKRYRV